VILLAGAAAGLGLFAAPWFAVARASCSRPFAPLSGRSAWCALLAAGIGAMAAGAQIAALSPILQRPVWFVLFAPPAIGIAPWAAGELCAGPSARQDEAFAAALVAAYLAAGLTQIPSLPLLLQTSSVAAAALVAYLCTRGSPA